IYAGADDFRTLGTQSVDVQLPVLEKTPIAGRVDGSLSHGLATAYRPGYFTQPHVTLSDRFSLDVGRDFLLQALTGVQAPGSPAASGDLFHYVINDAQLAASYLDPFYRTLALKTGSLDLLLADMAVDTFSLSARDGLPAVYQIELVGSGMFSYFADADPVL